MGHLWTPPYKHRAERGWLLLLWTAQCLHGLAHSLLRDSKPTPGQPAPGEMTVGPPGGHHGKIKRMVWGWGWGLGSQPPPGISPPYSVWDLASWEVGEFLLDSLQSLDCLSVLPLLPGSSVTTPQAPQPRGPTSPPSHSLPLPLPLPRGSLVTLK